MSSKKSHEQELLNDADSSRSADVGREVVELHLNLLALQHNYRYRVDIRLEASHSHVQFLRTFNEAQAVGMSARKSSKSVRFWRIERDGSLKDCSEEHSAS